MTRPISPFSTLPAVPGGSSAPAICGKSVPTTAPPSAKAATPATRMAAGTATTGRGSQRAPAMAAHQHQRRPQQELAARVAGERFEQARDEHLAHGEHGRGSRSPGRPAGAGRGGRSAARRPGRPIRRSSPAPRSRSRPRRPGPSSKKPLMPRRPRRSARDAGRPQAWQRADQCPTQHGQRHQHAQQHRCGARRAVRGVGHAIVAAPRSRRTLRRRGRWPAGRPAGRCAGTAPAPARRRSARCRPSAVSGKRVPTCSTQVRGPTSLPPTSSAMSNAPVRRHAP